MSRLLLAAALGAAIGISRPALAQSPQDDGPISVLVAANDREAQPPDRPQRDRPMPPRDGFGPGRGFGPHGDMVAPDGGRSDRRGPPEDRRPPSSQADRGPGRGFGPPWMRDSDGDNRPSPPWADRDSGRGGPTWMRGPQENHRPSPPFANRGSSQGFGPPWMRGSENGHRPSPPWANRGSGRGFGPPGMMGSHGFGHGPPPWIQSAMRHGRGPAFGHFGSMSSQGGQRPSWQQYASFRGRPSTEGHGSRGHEPERRSADHPEHNPIAELQAELSRLSQEVQELRREVHRR